jgi:hypothetical protein
VLLSFADTFKIPFASISKVTSICGLPLGAFGIPPNSKSPNFYNLQPFLFIFIK